MNTLTRYDRPGTLERVTDSTAFAVLFGMASVVLAPVVLLGLIALPGVILSKTGMQLTDELALLLPYGGLIGYIGLFRARRPATSAVDHWVTLVCLGIGIATTATLIGGLVEVGDGFAAGAVVVLSLPIIAALGRIARLRRLRAGIEGRVPDSLPLILLSIALGEAACAIAICVRLAIAA
jgi:hypothetical protein